MDKTDNDFLHYVDIGDLQGMLDMLEKGANLNTSYPATGFTALHFAADSGYLDIAKLLLEKGMQPNVQNERLKTPLMLAAENGHLEIAKLLIQSNADVNAQDHAGVSTLMGAASFDQKEIVQELLSAKADVKARDNEGNDVLMWAVSNASSELIRMLIEAGANPNCVRINGATAIYLAYCNRTDDQLTIIRELAKGKPEINLEADVDYQWAKIKNAKEVMTILEQEQLDRMTQYKNNNDLTSI